MWDEAGTEMAQAGNEISLSVQMTQGTEMTQAGTEMTQAGRDDPSGYGNNPSGYRETQAGTEMAQAGTEMTQVGTVMEFQATEYISINEIVAQDANDGPVGGIANQSNQDIDLRGWVIEDGGQNTIMFAPVQLFLPMATYDSYKV